MRRKDDEVLKKEIANRLRNIRNSLGMTQEQFAEILELSVSAYKKMESSENQISIESLRKLEQKLKVSSDYILFGKHSDANDTWKRLMNCSEPDKMMMLLRLVNYFTKSRSGHYLTEDVQKICDKDMLNILKEMDI